MGQQTHPLQARSGRFLWMLLVVGLFAAFFACERKQPSPFAHTWQWKIPPSGQDLLDDSGQWRDALVDAAIQDERRHEKLEVLADRIRAEDLFWFMEFLALLTERDPDRRYLDVLDRVVGRADVEEASDIMQVLYSYPFQAVSDRWIAFFTERKLKLGVGLVATGMVREWADELEKTPATKTKALDAGEVFMETTKEHPAIHAQVVIMLVRFGRWDRERGADWAETIMNAEPAMRDQPGFRMLLDFLSEN